jgi:endogenous inhibitor of DNA gyrase (YacG/DUF329 family)
MEKTIIYNGRKYRKHPNQKYYYVSRKGKNYSTCLHRQIWFDAFGEIPKGAEVHHINGNAFDNRLDNLELKKVSDHRRDHMIERAKKDPTLFIKLQQAGIKKAPEWHRSPEGSEWHKKHALKSGFGKQTFGNHNCEFCDREFVKKNATSKFCGNNCKSSWRRKYKPDLILAKCNNCGNEFETQKYQARKFCSKGCRPVPNPFGMTGKHSGVNCSKTC